MAVMFGIDAAKSIHEGDIQAGRHLTFTSRTSREQTSHRIFSFEYGYHKHLSEICRHRQTPLTSFYSAFKVSKRMTNFGIEL